MDQKVQRLKELTYWANDIVHQLLPDHEEAVNLHSVSGDASFRRYFRLTVPGHSFIAVDAPPEKEDSATFVRLSNLFRDAGVRAPKVFSSDYDKGFMLLDDFGDELYLDRLLRAQEANDENSINALYNKAIDSLLLIQKNIDHERLDPYDRELLGEEMSLFTEWFCAKFLELELTVADHAVISAAMTFLEDAALSQPVVAVHRDYHSRNLMYRNPDTAIGEEFPGVIDFQDAVAGPYTYDLVSLLRDCYIRWDPAQVQHWALSYLAQVIELGIIEARSPTDFLRDFDLMGVQRHLKVMGIFSRLAIRDNKPRYQADIPMVIRYFLEVARNYKELAAFVSWFEQKVLPVAETKL